MGELHIVKTNVKKNKGNTISFVSMVLLASLLLCTGIAAMTQVNRLFLEKSNELNSIHGAFWIRQDEFKDSYLKQLESDERITEINHEPIIYLNDAEIDFGGTYDSNTILMKLEQERSISPVKLVLEDKTISREQAVYLPYSAVQAGYSLGDGYTITYKNVSYEFITAGFYEALEFTRVNDVALRCYLPDAAFETMKAETGVCQYVSFRCSDEAQAVAAAQGFKDVCDITFSSMGTGNALLDFDDLQSGITIPNYIMGGLLVGISFIIAFIVLLFLRFRLHNSIDQNVRSFGVLQAMGYTSRQILRAYVLEYGIISLTGAILGGAASILLLPLLKTIMGSMTGVQFSYKADMPLLFLMICILTAFITLTARLSCRPILRLTPVMALSGGIAAHNFRKNPLPLQQGYGALPVRMGLKNIFTHLKSYIMIGLIIAGVTVVLTFCMNMYSSFALDKTALIKMSGVEVADLSVTVTSQTDAMELSKEIESMDEVKKTSMYDWSTFKVENLDVAGFCSDDFGLLEMISFHSGTYPELDNEIAITPLLSELLDKKPGDAISVQVSGVTKEFLITGFFTSTNNGGRAACITYEGYQRMQPAYQRSDINIYLEEGQSAEEVREILKKQFGLQGDAGDTGRSDAEKRAEEKISLYLERFGVNSVDYAVMQNGRLLFSGSSSQNKLLKITSLKDLIDVQIGSYVSGIAAFVQAIFFISFLIVFIVVYMTVKNMIGRQSLDLGIQKAIGFETRQLILQYLISFSPSVLLGTVGGAMVGIVVTNPIMTAMFTGIGAGHVNLNMNITAIFLIGLGILAVSLGVVLLAARNIKHISAYQLIIE